MVDGDEWRGHARLMALLDQLAACLSQSLHPAPCTLRPAPSLSPLPSLDVSLCPSLPLRLFACLPACRLACVPVSSSSLGCFDRSRSRAQWEVCPTRRPSTRNGHRWRGSGMREAACGMPHATCDMRRAGFNHRMLCTICQDANMPTCQHANMSICQYANEAV